ncbi:L-ascorbate oxidase [Vitis vinifera]|uniref:L-ascorbate oxidase n=1 Tax=Vitis vinifera TaxID=29760 RepID=A0A438GCT8_VITVI|nr:L-ascorbate oxidase [Vitis vinifera]
MVMVEADGNYIQPVACKRKRAQDSSRPHHSQLPNNFSFKAPTSTPPVSPLWNDYNHSKSFSNKILALMGSPKPPTTYNRRIILLNTQNTINGFTKWAINNISLTLPPTPYLGAIKHRLSNAFDQKSPPENFPNDYDVMKPPTNTNSTYGNGVYMLEFRTTVDVIFKMPMH